MPNPESCPYFNLEITKCLDFNCERKDNCDRRNTSDLASEHGVMLGGQMKTMSDTHEALKEWRKAIPKKEKKDKCFLCRIFG